ncbi:MAG: PGPGW domain-containing protein [Thiotrichales bacterium]
MDSIELLWEIVNPWVYWLATLSVVTFLASIILIPWLVISLPEDYFVDRQRHLSRMHQRHPVRYHVIRVAKNSLAVVLIAAGVLMLVLPGQGLLTILIGLSISDFPGKYPLERRLVRQPGIYRALNWIRDRYHKPPLWYPNDP